MLKLVKWLSVAGACALPVAGYCALRTIEFEGVVTVTSGIGDFLYPVGSPMKAKVTWEDSAPTTVPVFPNTVDHKFISSTWDLILNGNPKSFIAPLTIRWIDGSESVAIPSAKDGPHDSYELGLDGGPGIFSSLNYDWDELQFLKMKVFYSDFIAFGERGSFFAEVVPETSTLFIAFNGLALWVYARRRVVRNR